MKFDFLSPDVNTYTGAGLNGGGYATSATWDDNNDNVADGFYSFCIELDEHLSNNVYDARLNYDGAQTNAVLGGEPVEDPLCRATAWLYYSYATGQFGSLDSAGRSALQYAIWFLEDEIDYADFAAESVATTYLDAAMDHYYGAGNWSTSDFPTAKGADYDATAGSGEFYRDQRCCLQDLRGESARKWRWRTETRHAGNDLRCIWKYGSGADHLPHLAVWTRLGDRNFPAVLKANRPHRRSNTQRFTPGWDVNRLLFWYL